MDLVAGLVIGFGVVFAISVWVLNPDLLAARCPYCNAPLDSSIEGNPIRSLQGLEIVRRTFRCTRCLYSHERMWLNRREPESRDEAHLVH